MILAQSIKANTSVFTKFLVHETLKGTSFQNLEKKTKKKPNENKNKENCNLLLVVFTDDLVNKSTNSLTTRLFRLFLYLTKKKKNSF
jgi:hypothetical protein